MTFSPEARQRGLDRRSAAKSEREALTEHLDGGWLLYPDAPPGVGWVLAPPSKDKETGAITPGGGSPLRYYRDRESAFKGLLRIKAYGYDPNA